MKRIMRNMIVPHIVSLEKIMATRRLAVRSGMTQVPTVDDVVFDRGRLIVTRSCEKGVQEDEVGGTFSMAEVYGNSKASGRSS